VLLYREKDGLWAVLAWLSILAYRSSGGTSSGGKKENLGDRLAKLAPGGHFSTPCPTACHHA
jgi:phosphoglucomutase